MSEIQTVAGHPPAAPGSVNATNFQDAPHSAWGFHHVRQLHPTEQVWRGSAAPTPFPEALRDVSGIAFETADGREGNVGQLLASNCTDGFIVLHRGVIIAETYGNGMRPQDPHILMSTTKSFTGTLTGILVARGVLDVEAPVSELLPALEGTGYDGAAIRHLLDMRVGLDYSEDYENPESDFALLDAAGGWRPPVRPDGPRTLLDFLLTVRPGPPHGGLSTTCRPTRSCWAGRSRRRPVSDLPSCFPVTCGSRWGRSSMPVSCSTGRACRRPRGAST